MTSRKKKAVAESSGLLRSLLPWKQEVTDEELQRWFHGPFMGGFLLDTIILWAVKRDRCEINEGTLMKPKAELKGPRFVKSEQRMGGRRIRWAGFQMEFEPETRARTMSKGLSGRM
ncbi:hypothetical protein AAG906_001406 [Vitis piasezkii]